MKFSITNNCKVCRELRPSTLAEIYDKMCFIDDNMEKIIKLLFKQYPLDSVSKEYKDNKEQLINAIDEIMLDTDSADDEFYLQYKEEHYILIELLTKEVAEDNDKDFVNLDNGYSEEELENYVVGGTLSIYTKLSDKYYFRFL